MPEFALLKSGQVVEYRELPERPPHIPHKEIEWFPVVRELGADAFTGVVGDYWLVRSVDPATLPLPVPDSVSPRQARLALLALGKLDAANAVVSKAPDEIKIGWEFSTVIIRNDPGVIAFGQALGLDAAALDALFIEAAKL